MSFFGCKVDSEEYSSGLRIPVGRSFTIQVGEKNQSIAAIRYLTADSIVDLKNIAGSIAGVSIATVSRCIN